MKLSGTLQTQDYPQLDKLATYLQAGCKFGEEAPNMVFENARKELMTLRKRGKLSKKTNFF